LPQLRAKPVELVEAGEADGEPLFQCGSPLRLTDHPGADVLPAFSPDGTLLMWTASRDTAGGRTPASQLWVARPDSNRIEQDLAAVPAAQAQPTEIKP
jgi:hypothetical protein